jgi:hypothetical protein
MELNTDKQTSITLVPLMMNYRVLVPEGINLTEFSVSPLSWFNIYSYYNILVISWWSVLLVKETGGPGENHPVILIKICNIQFNAQYVFLE